MFNKFKFCPFDICLTKEKKYKGNNFNDKGIKIPFFSKTGVCHSCRALPAAAAGCRG